LALAVGYTYKLNKEQQKRPLLETVSGLVQTLAPALASQEAAGVY